ncbi:MULTISPECIES: DNA-binding protein [Acinetobacter]|uniref:DNA-binding protein n=1 Tax=Acinetobacter TaxID=469 RepID=UPI00141B3B41|nr:MULTISPECIES: DNA-binding protein [Acinetobacter]MCS4298917.1 hypothetical protein [Acinetobacter guillouiae]MCW2252345.1 hypothetical protein [Acinetobacter sp. BIGb0204]NII38068.1 hypothetical protein [Acinetobacter sp. BIGb0196]
MESQENLIIYHTDDGKDRVALYARDGDFFMNQAQLAELFNTSVQNTSNNILSILNEKELLGSLVVKDYLITALSPKKYKEQK